MLGSNPLPASLNLDVKKLTDLSQFNNEAKMTPIVDSTTPTDYNSDVISKLNTVITVIEWVGAIIAIILLTISIVIIMNTIRTAVYSRRTEIEIMKLVGATDWFVRWPFILEGMLGGLLAAIFSGAIVFGAYRLFVQAAQGNLLSVPFDARYTITLLIVLLDRRCRRRCLRQLPRRPQVPAGLISRALAPSTRLSGERTRLAPSAPPIYSEPVAERVDIAILGGGMGGYPAAIRAAQLGLSVVLVEEDKVGGTCLHRGCIPAKALLQSAALLDELRHADAFGVTTGDVHFDYAVAGGRRDSVVSQLHKGVQFLLRKNKVSVVNGRGRLDGPGTPARHAAHRRSCHGRRRGGHHRHRIAPEAASGHSRRWRGDPHQR